MKTLKWIACFLSCLTMSIAPLAQGVGAKKQNLQNTEQILRQMGLVGPNKAKTFGQLWARIKNEFPKEAQKDLGRWIEYYKNDKLPDISLQTIEGRNSTEIVKMVLSQGHDTITAELTDGPRPNMRISGVTLYEEDMKSFSRAMDKVMTIPSARVHAEKKSRELMAKPIVPTFQQYRAMSKIDRAYLNVNLRLMLEAAQKINEQNPRKTSSVNSDDSNLEKYIVMLKALMGDDAGAAEPAPLSTTGLLPPGTTPETPTTTPTPDSKPSPATVTSPAPDSKPVPTPAVQSNPEPVLSHSFTKKIQVDENASCVVGGYSSTYALSQNGNTKAKTYSCSNKIENINFGTDAAVAATARKQYENDVHHCASGGKKQSPCHGEIFGYDGANPFCVDSNPRSTYNDATNKCNEKIKLDNPDGTYNKINAAKMINSIAKKGNKDLDLFTKDTSIAKDQQSYDKIVEIIKASEKEIDIAIAACNQPSRPKDQYITCETLVQRRKNLVMGYTEFDHRNGIKKEEAAAIPPAIVAEKPKEDPDTKVCKETTEKEVQECCAKKEKMDPKDKATLSCSGDDSALNPAKKEAGLRDPAEKDPSKSEVDKSAQNGDKPRSEEKDSGRCGRFHAICIVGALLVGAAIAGLVWLFTRKKKKSKPAVNNFVKPVCVGEGCAANPIGTTPTPAPGPISNGSENTPTGSPAVPKGDGPVQSGGVRKLDKPPTPNAP